MTFDLTLVRNCSEFVNLMKFQQAVYITLTGMWLCICSLSFSLRQDANSKQTASSS